ncbi:MAG: hypothetical protein E6J90_24630 [Deltaproteobacteria bacterium]|nr:MAG: hypothetical protein E6J90_24630 [Deltaproteobacteria bacterium]TMQ21818.1 MAG: hypothetical protein E6J91_02120 [Deltaproteobacteria bacterium]
MTPEEERRIERALEGILSEVRRCIGLADALLDRMHRTNDKLDRIEKIYDRMLMRMDLVISQFRARRDRDLRREAGQIR